MQAGRAGDRETAATGRAGLAFALAAAGFLLLFRFEGLGPLDFWWGMASLAGGLCVLAARFDRGLAPRLRDDLRAATLRKIARGALSAAVLYAVFAAGNAAARALAARAGADIDAVYRLRELASTPRIVLLMALVIGPGEEVFWRGFLQERLAARWGPRAGLALAAAGYTAVHVTSANLLLVVAAAVCGLFWGWLYLRFRSVLLNAVSHALWDVTVFVLLPLGG